MFRYKSPFFTSIILEVLTRDSSGRDYNVILIRDRQTNNVKGKLLCFKNSVSGIEIDSVVYVSSAKSAISKVVVTHKVLGKKAYSLLYSSLLLPHEAKTLEECSSISQLKGINRVDKFIIPVPEGWELSEDKSFYFRTAPAFDIRVKRLRLHNLKVGSEQLAVENYAGRFSKRITFTSEKLPLPSYYNPAFTDKWAYTHAR